MVRGNGELSNPKLQWAESIQKTEVSSILAGGLPGLRLESGRARCFLRTVNYRHISQNRHDRQRRLEDDIRGTLNWKSFNSQAERCPCVWSARKTIVLSEALG